MSGIIIDPHVRTDRARIGVEAQIPATRGHDTFVMQRSSSQAHLSFCWLLSYSTKGAKMRGWPLN